MAFSLPSSDHCRRQEIVNDVNSVNFNVDGQCDERHPGFSSSSPTPQRVNQQWRDEIHLHVGRKIPRLTEALHAKKFNNFMIM